MKKKILDRSYGTLFGYLGVFPPLLLEIADLVKHFPEKNLPGTTMLVLYLNFICIVFLLDYVLSDFLFKRAILIEKQAFDPIGYFQENRKYIFWEYIFPMIQSSLLIIVFWKIKGDFILRNYIVPLGKVTIWHGVFFLVVFLFSTVAFSFLNKPIIGKMLKNDFFSLQKMYEFIDWNANNDMLNRILGKHVSVFFLIVFIPTASLGSLYLLASKRLGVVEYFILLFLILFVYSLFYVKKKTGKFLLWYCILGALPFGFIFPAFLPQKRSNAMPTDAHEG